MADKATLPGIVIRSDSGSTRSQRCSSGSGSSRNAVANHAISESFTEVFLKVTHGEETRSLPARIDTSAEICETIEHHLTNLQNELGVFKVEELSSKVTLSGPRSSGEGFYYNNDKQLRQAFDQYRSGDFTRIEIHRTIEGCRESATTIRQTVQTLLHSKMISSKHHGQFIPFDILRETLSKTLVRKLFQEDEMLARLDASKFTELVDKIHREGLRFLTTIIRANINPFGGLIFDFKRFDMLDSAMPFNLVDFPHLCTQKYGHYTCGLILQNQWSTIALELKPYTNEFISQQPFSADYIIPFEEMEPLHGGGFGDVWVVKIHHAYQHILPGKANPYFALKLFKRANDKSNQDFNRELNALVHISGQGNKHLMQLHTAFQHGDEFFLLFPLAACSLKDCFNKQDHVGNEKYFRWMLGQLLGLAEGIRAIHGDTEPDSNFLTVPQETGQVLGYHHDLKPDNVLLRKDSENAETPFNELEMEFGRLQISDFGLGRFRDAATGSVSVNIKGTPTYAAPESVTHGSQSRPYDIWSYGCIVLEALVWLLEGPEGLNEFIDERKRDHPLNSDNPNVSTDRYWIEEKAGVILNKNVASRMEKIRRNENFPQYSKTICAVIDLVGKCFEIDPKRRPRAKALSQEMRFIYERM